MRTVLWAAAACLLVAACSAEDGEEESRCGPSRAEVLVVIDGDTVELTDGQKIRYLLIDTPETTKGEPECYGPEAKDFNAELVLGQTVELKYDVECEDRYGRLLAYVSVDGREVNSLLVERGFAEVMYLPETGNGKDRLEEFKALLAEAKAAGRGRWGYCTD